MPLPLLTSFDVMENQRCSATGCDRRADASLETRPLCREHFISVCYERLEGCADRLHQSSFADAEAESLRRFLEECMPQAASISQRSADLDNLARARLLDILQWASELGGRMRRSSRKPVSLPVILRSEIPGRLWEEGTRTEWLSRHGAMVVCRHAVQTGDHLQVRKQDSSDWAEARVVWQRRKSSGEFEAGLEFTSEANFWGLE